MKEENKNIYGTSDKFDYKNDCSKDSNPIVNVNRNKNRKELLRCRYVDPADSNNTCINTRGVGKKVIIIVTRMLVIKLTIVSINPVTVYLDIVMVIVRRIELVN